jgi:hypothetical protein
MRSQDDSSRDGTESSGRTMTRAGLVTMTARYGERFLIASILRLLVRIPLKVRMFVFVPVLCRPVNVLRRRR